MPARHVKEGSRRCTRCARPCRASLVVAQVSSIRAQPYIWAAAVFVDKLDAGQLKSPRKLRVTTRIYCPENSRNIALVFSARRRRRCCRTCRPWGISYRVTKRATGMARCRSRVGPSPPGAATKRFGRAGIKHGSEPNAGRGTVCKLDAGRF
jgi:hypothetical protein